MSQFHQNMEKRKPSINLSIFTVLTESFSMDKPTKSPRNFDNGCGVGLGIVAAMTDSGNTQESAKFTNPASSPRSSPIPIVSLAKPAANFNRGGRDGALVVDESDESYTCVISHVGNNVIKKRIYYGDEIGGLCDDKIRVFDVDPGLFYASSSPMVMTTMISDGEGRRKDFWTRDFLSSCHLCNKLLHGLDIFMYRGEKAFCSAECRDEQIRSEDYKEKRGYEAMKLHDCSMSPCSSPQVLFAGVAAA